MSSDNGGQAFPRAEGEYSSPKDGMTLRDYFAGQALAGLMAAPDESLPVTNLNQPTLASLAYSHADDMLAERDK